MGMPQQLLDGNDVHAIFEQMGSITVAQRMERNFFFDIRLLQAFAYDPAQPFHAVPPVWFFAIKQPYVRTFGRDVFYQSFGNVTGQRHDPIFLVFALTDVDGAALEVYVRKFQVDGLLGTQSCRIDQSQSDTVF